MLFIFGFQWSQGFWRAEVGDADPDLLSFDEIVLDVLLDFSKAVHSAYSGFKRPKKKRYLDDFVKNGVEHDSLIDLPFGKQGEYHQEVIFGFDGTS